MDFSFSSFVGQKVKRQYWQLIGIILVATLITSAVSIAYNLMRYNVLYDNFVAINIVNLIILCTLVLLVGPIDYGLCFVFMQVSKLEDARINNLFCAFGEKYGVSIGLYLLITLKTFLWYLLFIIPGIVKTYAYSMSTYILIDNPDMSPSEAIKKSDQMMKGHKFDLFLVQLSLILYYLPALAFSITKIILNRNYRFQLATVFGILSLIASIMYQPLLKCITADFYYTLKGEYVNPDDVMTDERLLYD